jgi:hypothetical protein
MINYIYPTTKELRQINPEKIQNLERVRPTFAIFPTVESQYWTLEWTQKDNWKGLQQLRGLNGKPSYVRMVGEKAFSAKPGAYGEYMTLDEEEMTLRAQNTPAGEPVNINDLVLEKQDYLNNREVDLIEYIHWKALIDGQFTFTGPTGAVYGDVFGVQSASFSDWSVLATATPLADLLALQQTVVGKSVAFDTGATLFMNSTTAAYLIQNKNANDLGGQMGIVVGGVKPFKTISEINALLNGFGLPSIVVYDEGYFTEAGTFTRWIPTDVISLIGRRTNGDTLGEYRMVRNINNDAMAPGRYEKVIDRKDEVPRTIEVHRGHNGGLVIFYGSAFVRITC